MPLEPFIKKLSQQNRLTEAESKQAFSIIFEGSVPTAQIVSFLAGLRVGEETIEEITGAVQALRQHSLTLNAPDGTIDVCGTGGTGHDTLNISTAAAFVVAACGVPVAKHGNRAVSGRVGSADVLAALGINLDANIDQQESALRDARICFMYAPHHNPAMRHVATARKELGGRTIFNLIGPLLNPSRARYQLTGVYNRKLVRPITEVLGKLNANCAWVVHGDDGLDEISITGLTDVAQVKNGTITEFTVNPADYGLKLAKMDDIKSGDPAHNAAALRHLLAGQKGAYRDIVLLNAAAALIITGKASDMRQGLAKAAQAIDSGDAQRTLDRLVTITKARAA